MTNETPTTLNPFLNIILQQIISYVKDHIDEIIAALLALLPGGGGGKEDVTKAVTAFKSSPSTTSFDKLVKALTDAGADGGQIAATIINEVNIDVPAKGAYRN